MRNRYQPAYRSAYRARAHLRPGARPAYRAAVRIPKDSGYWFPQPNHVKELCKIVRQILKLPPHPEKHINNVQFWTNFGRSCADQPQNHTKNVQFCTTFDRTNSDQGQNHTRNVQFCTSFGSASVPNSQLSTLNSQLPRSQLAPQALVDLEHNERLLSALSIILAKMKRQRGRITLIGLVNLFKLASLLGRRACGTPEDPERRIRRLEIEAALLKVYGSEVNANPNPG